VHIPKFRNGAEKILANASTPDFFGASDIILGYALFWISSGKRFFFSSFAFQAFQALLF
jgi:hypothetical protein